MIRYVMINHQIDKTNSYYNKYPTGGQLTAITAATHWKIVGIYQGRKHEHKLEISAFLQIFDNYKCN